MINHSPIRYVLVGNEEGNQFKVAYGPDHQGDRTVDCLAEEVLSKHDPNGAVIGMRNEVPFNVAWAITEDFIAKKPGSRAQAQSWWEGKM